MLVGYVFYGDDVPLYMIGQIALWELLLLSINNNNNLCTALKSPGAAGETLTKPESSTVI